MNNSQDHPVWDHPVQNHPAPNHLEREYHIQDDSYGEHTPTYYGPPPDDDESIGDNTIERNIQYDREFRQWVERQRMIAVHFERRIDEEGPAAYMTYQSSHYDATYDQSFAAWLEHSSYGEQVWHQAVDHTHEAFTFDSNPIHHTPQQQVQNLEGAYQFLRFYMTQQRYRDQDEDTKTRIQTILHQLARLLGVLYYTLPHQVTHQEDTF